MDLRSLQRRNLEQVIKKRVRRSFAIALVLGVIVSAILILIGTVFINPILGFLNVPGKLFIEAKQYILIIIIGLWVTMFYDILMAVMRAIGDTLTPLLILAISVGLNIVLDLYLLPYGKREHGVRQQQLCWHSLSHWSFVVFI